MDDDVQACLDTPLSHINGGGISFVVPDPDSNSSGTQVLKYLNYTIYSACRNRMEIYCVQEKFPNQENGNLHFITILFTQFIYFTRWCTAESTASTTIKICTTSWY